MAEVTVTKKWHAYKVESLDRGMAVFRTPSPLAGETVEVPIADFILIACTPREVAKLVVRKEETGWRLLDEGRSYAVADCPEEELKELGLLPAFASDGLTSLYEGPLPSYATQIDLPLRLPGKATLGRTPYWVELTFPGFVNGLEMDIDCEPLIPFDQFDDATKRRQYLGFIVKGERLRIRYRGHVDFPPS